MLKQKINTKTNSLNLQLITGSELAWNEVEDYCETWYELLAGWLFYTDPTVKSYELGRVAKKCISKAGVRNHMKHLDTVLLAAMESNILQVSSFVMKQQMFW